MFGLYNINKPTGPTSHDIVATVRRMLPRKTKVGHAGTLDPFASGVLVVCVGPATRLADYVQTQSKRYRAGIHLGATSNTDDAEGEISQTPNATQPTREDVEAMVRGFVGEISQIPPAHSAVHIDGQRAYELARQGKDVQIPARQVHIYDIQIADYTYPMLTIDVHCGSGTYIRSLARDIGRELHTGGYCQTLVRTAIGELNVDSGVSPADLDIEADMLTPELAIPQMGRYCCTDVQLADIVQGKRLFETGLDADDDTEIALMTADGHLAGLAKWHTDDSTLRPAKVFIQQ